MFVQKSQLKYTFPMCTLSWRIEIEDSYAAGLRFIRPLRSDSTTYVILAHTNVYGLQGIAI